MKIANADIKTLHDLI